MFVMIIEHPFTFVNHYYNIRNNVRNFGLQIRGGDHGYAADQLNTAKYSDGSSEMNFTDVLQNALSGKDQRVRSRKRSDLVSVSGEMILLNFNLAVNATCDVDKTHGLFIGSPVRSCDTCYGYAYIGFGNRSTALCHLGCNLG